ncbi:MAG: protein-methionine-sulfoxide reductase catalytic subunit MsrP [Betaproteobacteria bacterium]|nr:protein-methionine-sulfoxide reductase catalytic subunit MsrP [Betaproteobacteria bacterium]
MLIRVRRFAHPIAPSEITPQSLYQARRDFLRAAGFAGIGLALPAWGVDKLAGVQKSSYSTSETPTPLINIASYNNYYEFGTRKDSPSENSGQFKTRPWTLRIEGLCAKPRSFAIEDLLKLAPLEERIYRMRCVEGWSMVIPWNGYPLATLLKQVEPLAGAKYVEFTTVADRATMPGLSFPVLDWPYTEGLRIDEAMHPLTLLTLGLYGEELLAQNGAPVRVVVPWKYGFKSAKSLVRIRLVDKQPATTWTKADPEAYGFYSNVNPEVDHPRWSQANERRLGEFLKRKTLMFNGYADQVAQLYAGMDLRKYF